MFSFNCVSLLRVSLELFIFLAICLVLLYHLYPQLLLRRELRTMPTPEPCAVCSGSLPTDGRFMKCVDCSKAYHLGKKCSGVSDGTFKGMSASKLEKWRCLACRGGLPRSDTEVELSPSQDDPSSFVSQLSSVNQKLDLLLSWKDTVGALHELHPKIDALLTLKQTVDSMRVTINEMQTSMNFYSTQYDSLVLTTKSHDKTIKDLQSETSALRSIVAEQTNEIRQLRTNHNDSDQTNRLSNLEIHGIPVSSQENIVNTMTNLADQLGVEGFEPAHVVVAHRLPAKPGTVPPILIRFSTVSQKERWMACRGRLGSIRQDESHPRIYFNDNLTEANRKLFWLARTRGKEKGYKFVWVRHGKIFAKQNQNSPLLRILNTDALEQLA